MGDIIFAWMFTVILFCILPSAQISRLETVITVGYLFVVGLYIYAVIERRVKRNRRRKLRHKKRINGKERMIA